MSSCRTTNAKLFFVHCVARGTAYILAIISKIYEAQSDYPCSICPISGDLNSDDPSEFERKHPTQPLDLSDLTRNNRTGMQTAKCSVMQTTSNERPACKEIAKQVRTTCKALGFKVSVRSEWNAVRAEITEVPFRVHSNEYLYTLAVLGERANYWDRRWTDMLTPRAKRALDGVEFEVEQYNFTVREDSDYGSVPSYYTTVRYALSDILKRELAALDPELVADLKVLALGAGPDAARAHHRPARPPNRTPRGPDDTGHQTHRRAPCASTQPHREKQPSCMASRSVQRPPRVTPTTGWPSGRTAPEPLSGGARKRALRGSRGPSAGCATMGGTQSERC